MTLLLGIEMELLVANPSATSWISPYEIIVSYPKNSPNGTVHKINGKYAQAIWNGSNQKIKVGYDYTVSAADTWAGYELTAEPLSLSENEKVWGAVFSDDIIKNFTSEVYGKTAHGTPRGCGLHIHVSPVTLYALERTARYVNNPLNHAIITAVAGRYNCHHCKIVQLPYESMKYLYHHPDCTLQGKITDLGYEWSDTSVHEEYELDEKEQDACCGHVVVHCQHIRDATWTPGQKRPGFNVLPYSNTGDCEFRIFKSPTTLEGFLAQMQFVHSLIRFAETKNEMSTENLLKWITASEDRKNRYRNFLKLVA